MKLEHVALNVPDVHEVADWYVTHLGFSVYRRELVAPFKTFLRDATEGVMLELYTNPEADIPNYARQHPTLFHLGFLVRTARVEQARLEAAGATLFCTVTTRDGTILTMMRDPWGIPLQLCQRN